MVGGNVCGICRAILTPADALRSPGACPYCGAKIQPEADPFNPYAPPEAELEGGMFNSKLDVPPDFLGKVALAYRLFTENFVPISLLVLTIWLPFHLLVAFLNNDIADIDERRIQLIGRVSRLVEGVFGPIYVGGILKILADRMAGRQTEYVSALNFGLSHWGSLFRARFIAGLLVFLGFLALIVPGVILSFRYALLDPVVVIEEVNGSKARERSKRLVQGKVAGILGGVVLCFLPILVVAMALEFVKEVQPDLNPLLTGTLFDCATSILSNLITCVLFVFFWEGHVQRPVGFDIPWKITEKPSGLPEDY